MGEFVSIEFDKASIAAFKKKLAQADAVAIREGKRALDMIALDLERRAVALAPLDQGVLQGSGVTRRARFVSRTNSIEAIVGFNEDYATRMHEDLDPAPGASMRRGHETIWKPNTEDGAPGGKYLERPLRKHAKRYGRLIAKMIKRVL